jgi:ABC-2 type transport system ATP-binding protein
MTLLSTNHVNDQAVIQIEGLTKRYTGMVRPALDHLSLTVNRGEIFGYLGPNGAGKTTTIRMLLDLIRPSEGHTRIFGLDAQQDSVALHKRIGFLPGELSLWGHYTGREVLAYLGRLRGGVDAAYVGQLAERLALDLSKTVRSYSSGNKRKLGLMIALFHQPELLILDEPTSGLDPLMQQTFNTLMLEARDEGRTVFLSSHILSEVQAICGRVGILRDGQLKAVEKVADLTRVKLHQVRVVLREAASAHLVANVPGVKEVTVEGNALTFTLTGDFDPVLRALGAHYIVDVQSQEPSLEDIFLSFYGNNNSRSNGKQAAHTSHKEMAR